MFSLLPYICIPGRVFRHYEVYFTLEIICEPAAPVKVIDVQCVAQVSSENIQYIHAFGEVQYTYNKLPSGTQNLASLHLLY